jgi:hypothetical protein
MAKIKVDLSNSLVEPTINTVNIEEKTLDDLAMGLPSISRAKNDAVKYAPRVQFAFSNVPKPIKDEFVNMANNLGISQKELLYKCLRAGGLNIPEYTNIDGRRR